MLPYLALVACIAFALSYLRLEHKKFPKSSASLWIPTLWFLYTTSKPLGIWLGKGGDMESGSPPDRIFLIILFSLGVFILLKRKFNWSIAAKENSWLILIIIFMFISVLWSDMPSISFRRGIRELVSIVMAFVVLSDTNPRSALQSIFQRSIYILIPLSIILVKYFPEYGREYGRWSGELMWIGVSTQKNGLARLCIIAVIFLFVDLVRKIEKKEFFVFTYEVYTKVFLIILSIYLLGGPRHTLNYSVTSTVSLIIGLLFYTVFSWARKHRKAINPAALKTFLFIIVIYGIVTPFFGKLRILDISSIFGRNETLTGRSIIWATLLPYATKKPMFGHGVGGFWTTSMREMTSSHAHNGYLDLILDIGFVGLFLFALYLFACLKRATLIISTDSEWGILFLSFIFMSLFYNIAESGIGALSSALSAVIMLFYVSSCDRISAGSLPSATS